MNDTSSANQLHLEIDKIKERNRRVEADKAWELSWTRKLVVFGLTYIVVLIVFLLARITKPFINALVPAVAFVLSTMTVGLFKKVWLRYFYKKEKIL